MEQQPIQNIQPPQVEEINLKEYLRIIYQFRYLIVIIFVVVIIGTILYTYQQPRIYSASSKSELAKETIIDYQSVGYRIENNIVTGKQIGRAHV